MGNSVETTTTAQKLSRLVDRSVRPRVPENQVLSLLGCFPSSQSLRFLMSEYRSVVYGDMASTIKPEACHARPFPIPSFAIFLQMFWVFSDRLVGRFCGYLLHERVLLDARNFKTFSREISLNNEMGNGVYAMRAKESFVRSPPPRREK